MRGCAIIRPVAVLTVENLAFAYADKELYDNVSFQLNEGEHAVLVGHNGSGKSTLLRLLTGKLIPDQGKISWTGGVSYSYLDQELKEGADQTVIDYLYGVFQPLFEKEKEMERLYEEGANGNEKALNRASRLQEELLDSGFYALQEKVGDLVDGLAFPKDKLNSPLSKLSSGQREKAFLAKMLLEEKDVLLLDEPTNYLDQNQVKWLIDRLNGYPHAFLCVSHDEAFLRQIAQIVFILENRRIDRYRGSYEHFEEQRLLDMEQYEKNYEAQQRYIKKEEEFIKTHIVRATSAMAAKSHRARLSHLVRMAPPSSDVVKSHFHFPFSHDVGERPLTVDALEIGYETPLLEPISFVLKKGEKIAIIGQNGVGKTTFLKTILGLLPPIGGSYKWLEGTTPSYFDSDIDHDLELTPFELLHNAYPNLDNTAIRSALGEAGVQKEKALRPLSELSGGERTKSRLALMSLRKSNFLIFDEPSNHLDQKAKEALYEAIAAFPGAVILVSHEKDFYDGLVDYELYF